MYKIDEQQDLLYRAGNYIQHLIISYSGKEPEKRVCAYLYIYVCLILLRIMRMVVNPIEQIRKLTGLQRLRVPHSSPYL